MRPTILIDTGPIVAALDRRDAHHAWAAEQFKTFPAPLLTCEAVLMEAAYLVQRAGSHPERVLDLITTGALTVSFDMEAEAEALKHLLRRYHDVPMDLADAALVRVAERESIRRIFTTDGRDFQVYRPKKIRSFSLIPEEG